ncbi:MAG: AMP-binding protein, partial [Ruminiclostridium sp.]|nr:AMP-binding protein [Ruminiclostridium sp.]
MKLFHERITEYATRFPDKAAVTDPRGEISYAQMETLSASFSRVLSALGVGAGDAVAVYVPYTKEILLGAVSAFRAGAVFIPFDSGYPTERLTYMLEDSGAKAILTMRELWEQKPLGFPAEKVIFMDEPPADEQKEVCCDSLTEGSPAMLLYTSGTTGKPKGVLHIHRMLLHIVDWMNIHEGAEMDEETRSGVITSFSFVGTQMFMLGPLSKGGTVCIAPEEARSDTGYLHRFLMEQRINHIFVPSGLAAILAEDYDIGGIFVFAAGEKLRNFRAAVPGNFLIDSYGSTETSGVLSKKIYGDETRILVGKPFVNTKAMIADETMKPVKPGEAGELLISNAFMSRQYWKQPELTAKKWTVLDGETWYHTGDRAVLNADGDYDILGRIDNMVKLRGFR